VHQAAHRSRCPHDHHRHAPPASPITGNASQRVSKIWTTASCKQLFFHPKPTMPLSIPPHNPCWPFAPQPGVPVKNEREDKGDRPYTPSTESISARPLDQRFPRIAIMPMPMPMQQTGCSPFSIPHAFRVSHHSCLSQRPSYPASFIEDT